MVRIRVLPSCSSQELWPKVIDHQIADKVKFKKEKGKGQWQQWPRKVSLPKQRGYCNQPPLFRDRQKAGSQEAINTHRTNGPAWQPQFPTLVLQVNN